MDARKSFSFDNVFSEIALPTLSLVVWVGSTPPCSSNLIQLDHAQTLVTGISRGPVALLEMMPVSLGTIVGTIRKKESAEMSTPRKAQLGRRREARAI